MSIWLDEEEIRKTAYADQAAFRSPVPTRMVSNGEYLPTPQTGLQRRVEHEIRELADAYGRRLGMDRRRFLKTSCGMAAAFLAMNRVYGSLFRVSAAEAADPAAAAERSTKLAPQFIFDVQNHFVRDDFEWDGILALGEFAKNWNPVLKQEGVTMHRYKFENYLKEVFLDSETKLALVSGAPADNPANSIVSNDQLARARELVNRVAGRRRLFSHSMIAPGQPGWLDEVDRCLEVLKPDSWKGYTVGDPLSPSKYPWRMDDEKLVYPFYEKIAKTSVRMVCIHKGLLSPGYQKAFKQTWEYAKVDDVGKAAKDWPELTFVIYHAGLKPFLEPPDENLAQFEKTGRMDWVTDLAEIPRKLGVKNVYAELGTSFASSAVTHPRHCAAMMGTLVKGMGADHVIWGTDSVWYGSPQWQIEAMRRLEIPDDMREKWGFAPLGPADGMVKNAIFGYNAARLYGLDLTLEGERIAKDDLSKARAEYLARGADPSNTAYGLIRVRN
jgi:predicted TIM-barrel fold metal-dependent hydrolase